MLRERISTSASGDVTLPGEVTAECDQSMSSSNAV